MSIEAMKQALEIIKNMRSGYGDDYPTEKERKTITALRQAIEEAEKQEPVAWIQEDRIVPELGYDCTMTREHPKELGYTPLYTAPPQAEKQEPVAWMEMVVANLVRNGINKHMARELAHHFYTYTAPPRKKWVGLTDEEIKNILDCGRGGLIDIKKAEQILKDKNT